MAGRTESDLFRVRPTLRTSLAAGVVFLVLFALGSWQVQRLIWKAELTEERTARAAAAVIDLPAPPVDLEVMELRPVRVNGTFLHEHEMFLAARSFDRRVGYHVLTPLRRADGRTVLVNRGWVAHADKDPANRSKGQIAGEVSVEGFLRGQRPKALFQPENDPDQDVWFWVDLEGITQRLGFVVEPFVIEAGPAPNPGGFPIGGQTRIELPNDHLQYAITWYALAFSLGVIFVIYHRRKPKGPTVENRGT